MPNKTRNKWQRPFNWPPETWEFTPGMQKASEIALALIFLLLVCTIICACIIWPVLIYRTVLNVSVGTTDDVRNTLLAAGALIGVPFLVWRTMIASRQTNISREGHYTGLFTKAVEQLGSEKTVKKREFKPAYQRDEDGEIRRDGKGNAIPQVSADGEPIGEYSSYEVTTTNYEIRLGAIYALERIMQDSRRDAWPIYLTLTAYIQNNGEPFRKDLQSGGFTERNNSDITEIFNVLDRYTGERRHNANMDFRAIHVPPLRFVSGHFQLANFEECSVASILLFGRSRDLNFRNCNVGHVELRRGEMYGLSIISSEVGTFVAQYVAMSGCTMRDSKSRYLIFSSSTCTDSSVSLDTKNYRIISSEFTRSRLTDQGNWSSGAQRMIRNSKFTDCTFVECDFSFMDVVDSVFENCVFERCNLVNTGGISVAGNKFVDCFDGEAIDKPMDMSPDSFELGWAWIAWRDRKRPDDYDF